jgi:hypothetical protein
MTRSLFGVIMCVVTGALIAAAILAPAGRLTQVLGLVALMGVMVTILVVSMSVVEFLSRILSHGSDTPSESGGIRKSSGPEKSTRARARDRHYA